MWFQKIVTKVLINLRFQLERLIVSKAPKSLEVTTECWNDLVVWRATELSKKKSAQMRSISKHKVSKASQMHGLGEAALVRLVSIPPCVCLDVFMHVYMDVRLNMINVCDVCLDVSNIHCPPLFCDKSIWLQ